MNTHNPLDILQVKRLVDAQPARISASVGSNGTGGYFRVRFFITTELFQKLFPNATSPRATVKGSIEEGLFIQVTDHGGATVRAQSKATLTFDISARDLASVESRVGLTQLNAVYAVYEDGSRYLLVPPLPDAFLRSARQAARRAGKGLQIFSTIERAIAMVGHVSSERPPEPEEERVIDEAPPPPPEAPVIERPPEPVTVVASSDAVDQLRSGLELLNEVVTSLKGTGTDVTIWLDSDGRVRANVITKIQL